MQNRQIGKGAEQKRYCALFFETDQKPVEREIDTPFRRDIRKLLRTFHPDLVLLGYPGLFAAAKVAEDLTAAQKQEAFPAWLWEEVRREAEGMPKDPEGLFDSEAASLLTAGGTCGLSSQISGILFPSAGKGVLADLWILGESLGCGIDASFEAIPMKQSVIEICDRFDVHPYETGGGTWLFVCQNGDKVVKSLEEAGVGAGVIGRITDGAERAFTEGAEKRYISPRRD